MKKPAILVAALLPLAAAVAAPAPQGHPHFDDGGTIQWQTKLPDAKAVDGSGGGPATRVALAVVFH